MPTHMPRVGRLPLTPPEIWGQYPSSAGGFCSTAPGFYSMNNDSRHGLESQDKYGSGKPPQLQPENYPELPQLSAPAYNALGARNDYGYGPIGAPILPPIRMPENATDKASHRQSVSHNVVREQPREEKVAGGVAAHLDYQMEEMVDFVAESTQGMYDMFEARFCLADIDVSRSVQPHSAVTPEFRKYVSHILTSTRLPSSTILLALHYLANRMSLLQGLGIHAPGTGHVYHMMTIALMLASKFLDDNTFQNRSWADVSHIPVAELNKHEREWLVDMSWDLHFNLEDPLGFRAWTNQWKNYCTKKAELQVSLEALKLTPVDAIRNDPIRSTYSAHRYGPQTPLYTPPYTETSFGSANRDRNAGPWQWTPARDLSPPSAGHGGSATPEWYKHNMTGFNQHSMAYSNRPLPPLQILPSNHSPFYGAYSQQFTPSPWNAHGPACQCGHCAVHHERYGFHATYGMQTVVG